MKNLGNMMKQAQQMQQKMQQMQEKLGETEVPGVSGGGMVQVILTGKGEMRKISIDKAAVDPDDIEMLEDLIVAAHNDAKGKAEAMMQEEMGKLTAGLPLPPGMKLPF
jgi:DNA-binding YbaB/EbfC family protein